MPALYTAACERHTGCLEQQADRTLAQAEDAGRLLCSNKVHSNPAPLGRAAGGVTGTELHQQKHTPASLCVCFKPKRLWPPWLSPHVAVSPVGRLCARMEPARRQSVSADCPSGAGATALQQAGCGAQGGFPVSSAVTCLTACGLFVSWRFMPQVPFFSSAMALTLWFSWPRTVMTCKASGAPIL